MLMRKGCSGRHGQPVDERLQLQSGADAGAAIPLEALSESPDENPETCIGDTSKH